MLCAMMLLMVAVNTGCRDGENCKLRWEWELKLSSMNTSVFIIPGSFVKNGDERLVMLNRNAMSEPGVFIWLVPQRGGRAINMRAQEEVVIQVPAEGFIPRRVGEHLRGREAAYTRGQVADCIQVRPGVCMPVQANHNMSNIPPWEVFVRELAKKD